MNKQDLFQEVKLLQDSLMLGNTLRKCIIIIDLKRKDK